MTFAKGSAAAFVLGAVRSASGVRGVRCRTGAGEDGDGCARVPSQSAAASGDDRVAAACANEPVTIAWSASEAAARVTIDGVGVSLPSSGNRVVTASASTIYSGRATTSCGAGDEALAVVTMTPAATASLSGPSSVTTGSSTTLNVVMHGTTSSSLRSSRGNAISPSSGSSSQTVTYSATRTGTDTVTLTTSGGACGNPTRTLIIVVSDPPATGGLRCCDGTRSPTCFSCASKRGCCSSHGGVCGCP